jgi:hypothetical protein
MDHKRSPEDDEIPHHIKKSRAVLPFFRIPDSIREFFEGRFGENVRSFKQFLPRRFDSPDAYSKTYSSLLFAEEMVYELELRAHSMIEVRLEYFDRDTVILDVPSLRNASFPIN